MTKKSADAAKIIERLMFKSPARTRKTLKMLHDYLALKMPPGFEEARHVWSRGAKQKGTLLGSRRRCGLAGCPGIRVGVRWPNKKCTWPCTQGLLKRPDGDLQIE